MAQVGEKNYTYNKMYWLMPNQFFASLISKLYARDDGEVLSFLQFSYFAQNLIPFGEEVGKTFEKIALDDLSHMKILAEMIVMLGEKPLLKTDNGKYFGGRAIKPENDLKSMTLNGIDLKEKAIINLKTTIAKIDNRYIKNALTTILNEEIYHLNILSALKEKIENPQN